MSILERLERDMVTAAKARDSVRLGVIRYARSELKNRAIEFHRELDGGDCLEVLSRIAKGHREAIEQAESQGRDEITKRERAQLAILEEYLPERLAPEQVNALVDEVVAETGATGRRDTGRVMKAIMPKVKGRADGAAVKDVVASKLSALEES